MRDAPDAAAEDNTDKKRIRAVLKDNIIERKITQLSIIILKFIIDTLPGGSRKKLDKKSI